MSRDTHKTVIAVTVLATILTVSICMIMYMRTRPAKVAPNQPIVQQEPAPKEIIRVGPAVPKAKVDPKICPCAKEAEAWASEHDSPGGSHVMYQWAWSRDPKLKDSVVITFFRFKHAAFQDTLLPIAWEVRPNGCVQHVEPKFLPQPND